MINDSGEIVFLPVNLPLPPELKVLFGGFHKITLINTPLLWDPKNDVFYFKKQSKVFERISAKHGIPIEKLQKEFETRTKLLYELYRQKIYGFEEVQKVINDYYKNPVEVLNKYNIVG